MEEISVAMDPARLRQITRELSDLDDLVSRFRAYKRTHEALDKTRALLRDETDEEMRLLAREEIEGLEADEQQLLAQLRLLLLPKDPRDQRDVFIEIRAGTGGEEEALFAADL